MTDFNDIIGAFDEITGERKPEVFATFVMDHSGSMRNERQMAIDNFNEQLATIKKNKEVTTYVTMIDFDDEIIVTGPIPASVKSEEKEYWIGGTTALNDAIAKAISLNEKMMKASKSDDKTSLIIVITDGHENASVEYPGPTGAEKLQELITEYQEREEWTFTFMGAGLDIQKYAVHSLGISEGNTMSFSKSAKGFESLSDTTSSALDVYYSARMRGGLGKTHNFIADEIKKTEDKTSMVTKQDGPLIDEPKEAGDPLWGGAGGDMLKTEGPEGNPLWKKKKRIDEDDADEPENLNE